VEITLGQHVYRSEYFERATDGCAGYRLHEELRGDSRIVAEIVFWDATGQFWLKTIGRDVPVDVILSAIDEAKATIRVR
jgi:hypothetical protein